MAELRINNRIRISPVRVIDEHGVQLGILATEEAKRIAWERGFDLVEVAPNVSPPVCKIMDYGKYKYAEQKKQHPAKKHRIQIKEIRLRPRTDEHDIQVKLNHIKDFLAKGDKAVVSMIFRGREKVHKEIGYQLMERIIKEIETFGKIETPLAKKRGLLMFTVGPKK